mgnify:CR=1 FL=1
MIINPQDRVGRSNLAEHDQMIEQGNANDAMVKEAKSESSRALAIANTASSRVDTAWQTASTALDKATTADTKASINTANITAINDDISTLNGLMDFITANALISVSFNRTATALTAVFRRKDGSMYSANLPIATATTAGFVDSAMKQQIDANSNAIATLSSNITIIFVTFPSANPTQAEINTVYSDYRTAYPNANLPGTPYQGMQMVDSLNNVTTIYDSIQSVWNFITNAVSVATNNNYGIIIGEENGADGSLYIVAGKALVNGFDALKGRMNDAESAIAIRVTTDTFNAHTASTTLHKTTDENTKLANLPVKVNYKALNVNINASSWSATTDVNPTTDGYTYEYMIPIMGVTADMYPHIQPSYAVITAGYLWHTAVSVAGGIKIYSNTAVDMTIDVAYAEVLI